jgi:5-enolpyruvylshikimate-3-phosphate synthase
MAKLGANFEELNEEHWKLSFEKEAKVSYTFQSIPTYDDHRMAMAIAPLCLVFRPDNYRRAKRGEQILSEILGGFGENRL